MQRGSFLQEEPSQICKEDPIQGDRSSLEALLSMEPGVLADSWDAAHRCKLFTIVSLTENLICQ